MRKRSSALGVGVLVLGLLAAGCGSSSDGSGGGQASAQQVNTECLAGNKKVAFELKKDYSDAEPSTEKEEIQLEVSVWVPALIAHAESQILAISSLEVPEEDEAEINRILDAYRSWIAKAKATPFKIVVANDVYTEARELAGKYGLAKCAEDPFEILRHS